MPVFMLTSSDAYLLVQAKCIGGALQFAPLELVHGIGLPRHYRTAQDGHAGERWDELLEEFQPFPGEVRGNRGQPGDVPPRTRQTGDEALLHRIT